MQRWQRGKKTVWLVSYGKSHSITHIWQTKWKKDRSRCVENASISKPCAIHMYAFRWIRNDLWVWKIISLYYKTPFNWIYPFLLIYCNSLLSVAIWFVSFVVISFAHASSSVRKITVNRMDVNSIENYKKRQRMKKE